MTDNGLPDRCHCPVVEVAGCTHDERLPAGYMRCGLCEGMVPVSLVLHNVLDLWGLAKEMEER